MSRHSPSRSIVLATNLVTLLLVLSAGFALFFIGSGVVGAIRGGTRDVSVHQQIDIDEVDSLPPATTVTEEVPVTRVIRDANPEQVWYSVGRDIAPAALVIAILWLLRGILYSVREGDPFTAANVRRLRMIGLLLIVGVPIAETVRSAFEQALASSAFGSGSGIAVSVPGNGILAGLGVFVLAQVFAHGVRLREDAEGTV